MDGLWKRRAHLRYKRCMPAAPDDRALVEAFDRYIDTAMDRYGSLLHPVAYDAFIDGLEEDLSLHRDELLVGLGFVRRAPADQPDWGRADPASAATAEGASRAGSRPHESARHGVASFPASTRRAYRGIAYGVPPQYE